MTRMFGPRPVVSGIVALAFVAFVAPQSATAKPADTSATSIVASQQTDHGVRYTSGHAMCAEALRDGHWIVAYRNADGRVNMPNEIWAGDAFVLEIDHERVDGGWEWVSFEEPVATRHCVVELRHPARAIRVRLHTELDGTPVLKRWLEIKNDSSKPLAISAVSPWGGRLASGEAWQLGYYRKDEHKMEGCFEWSALPRWQTTIASVNGQGHDAPFFVLRNDTSGEYFIGSLAWSANWRLYLFQDRSGKVTFELGPYAEAPLRIVAPGETVSSPAMHLAHVSGDLDDAVQAMHAHARQSVIPAEPENAGLVQYRVPADQGYHVPFNEETARENVDMAAAIGAELFILDAYWWDVTCDWYPSKQRFPNGLEPLIDYVRKKGMRFGLYTEAEGGRGNVRDSVVAHEHPDWIGMKGIVNVGIPEAAAWVESEIERLVTRYKLDLFELDFNPEVTGGGIHTVQQGMPENNYWRYYEGCNALYDRVLRRHPKLAMQQCAGGGARNDLGMMQVFHQTLVSDGLWIPREQQAFAGQALMLPPESLIVLHGATGYVSPGYPENFDTVLRTTFALGTPQIFSGIVAPSPAELTSDRRERFLHYGKIYKEFIRPLLPVSRMYQHAPVTKTTGVSTNDWFAVEYASPDRTKGWLTCIRLANGPSDTFVFRARGLDPGKKYRVTFDRSGTVAEMSGTQLATEGIPIRLETIATSELLLFERI
jgi:alpha-galactosidase